MIRTTWISQLAAAVLALPCRRRPQLEAAVWRARRAWVARFRARVRVPAVGRQAAVPEALVRVRQGLQLVAARVPAVRVPVLAVRVQVRVALQQAQAEVSPELQRAAAAAALEPQR